MCLASPLQAALTQDQLEERRRSAEIEAAVRMQREREQAEITRAAEMKRQVPAVFACCVFLPCSQIRSPAKPFLAA